MGDEIPATVPYHLFTRFITWKNPLVHKFPREEVIDLTGIDRQSVGPQLCFGGDGEVKILARAKRYGSPAAWCLVLGMVQLDVFSLNISQVINMYLYVYIVECSWKHDMMRCRVHHDAFKFLNIQILHMWLKYDSHVRLSFWNLP